MAERFAYVVFLTVVFSGLVVMTVGLAVTWIFLLRRNRRSDRARHTPVRRTGDQMLPKPTPARWKTRAGGPG